MKNSFFKTKKFIFGIIILLLAGGGALAYRHIRAKKELKKLEDLSPVKVVKGLFVVKTQAIGVVEPENRVMVTPSVNGRAEEVLFHEGDMEKKGRILAWVSSSERTALLDSLKMKDSTPEEKKMVEEAADDIAKAFGGNKAAGTRVRKSMQDIKNAAQDVRKRILEIRSATPK